MRIALYQPDIPQNTAAILRTAACLGVTVDLIGPAGFDVSERALRRAGLDYLQHVSLARHTSWQHFLADLDATSHRLVLLTTHATQPHHTFDFDDNDILLFGRESAGVPDDVHARADQRVRIPMRDGLRSLNLAVAVGMIASHALTQTGGWSDSLV
ncbi:MAG: tRNA (cytidine(34)-2'-O)-methyltransferase [Pseudomonadota bacterium]